MQQLNRLAPSGELAIKKLSPPAKAPIIWKIRNLPHLLRAWRIPLALALRIPTVYGKLSMVHISAAGRRTDYGVVSYRVVTTAFVNEMVDQLQTEDSTWGDFKFHDSGVGTTAEDAGDTDIETTDGESRATGTQTEGATANIYRSVGTISYTTTKAITEHGLFNASTAGELMDRTVFAARNVVNGDSIQFTYELTLTAGS
jgi:hypothetical protein